MGRTVFWTSVAVLFCALFQAAILANIAFLPVVPDLVLLVVVYVSFVNGSTVGSTTGFISGLFLDFLSASPIGLNSFTKPLIGFVAGKFSGSFILSPVLIPMGMGLVATVMKAATTLVLSLFFGSGILAYRLNGEVLWLEILANSLCAPLIFGVLGFFPNLFSTRVKAVE